MNTQRRSLLQTVLAGLTGLLCGRQATASAGVRPIHGVAPDARGEVIWNDAAAIELDRMRQAREAVGWAEPSPWLRYDYEGNSICYPRIDLVFEMRRLVRYSGKYEPRLATRASTDEVLIVERGEEHFYPLWKDQDTRDALARHIARLQSPRNGHPDVWSDVNLCNTNVQLYDQCAWAWGLLQRYNELFCTGCNGCCCGEHLKPSKFEITITGLDEHSGPCSLEVDA